MWLIFAISIRCVYLLFVLEFQISRFFSSLVRIFSAFRMKRLQRIGLLEKQKYNALEIYHKRGKSQGISGSAILSSLD